MRKILIYILFFLYIKISFSIIPLWNFTSSEIASLDKEVYKDNFRKELYWCNYNINITISSDENGVITEEKVLSFDRYSGQIKIDYDDIESAYNFDDNELLYVCPKGRYHVYTYSKNNYSENQLYPPGFTENGDWDLICYYQYINKVLFIIYTNNNKFFLYDIKTRIFMNYSNYSKGIYGFNWELKTSETIKPMIVLTKNDNNKLALKKLNFDMEKLGDLNIDNNEKNIVDLKSNYKGFFEFLSHPFYWINYNDVFDFCSGYYNNKASYSILDYYKIKVEINNTSPFQFIDKNIEIQNMQFYYYSKYVYYKILNKDRNKTYHGIIDITLNQIIFNTDEDLKLFRPYYDNSSIAITKDNKVYKICFIKNETGGCTSECKNNDIILDTTKSNRCGEGCQSNFILKPSGICLDKCDENIYTIRNGNECGLCKDLDINNPIKLINYTGCFEKPPKNSEYMNENLNIVACKKGYNYFQEGECVNKCSDGYFLNENTCEKCDELCKSCEINSTNCTSCDDGYYLDLDIDLDSITYTCKDCIDNYCETCEKIIENDTINCLSCDLNSEFMYLYDKKCLDYCPNGTIKSNYTCLIKKEINSDSKGKVFLIIFIIIISILLLLNLFYFFKQNCNREFDNDLAEEMNFELVGNKEFDN